MRLSFEKYEDALNLGKVKYDVGQTDLSPVCNWKA